VEILLPVLFALLGASVGSFLNVCIDRLPRDKSIVTPSSHCDSCQRRLSPRDLVPVLSYLLLRGKCRYCQSKIPLRPLLVEITTGLLFALAYITFGLTLQLPLTLVYTSLFLVIGIIDLEHGLILNKITFPAAVTAILIDFFVPPPGITEISSTWNGILSGVIGAVIGLTFLLIIYLVSFAIYKQEAMGLGDVKLAALIGLVVGSRLVLFSLLMGALLGGLVASGLLLFRIKGRKETIPFGSFLSLATIISLFWGNQILDWYLGLYGF